MMGQGQSSSTPADGSLHFVENEAADCRACANPCQEHTLVPGYLKLAAPDEPMEGTFGKPYGKHLVICSNVGDWPPRLLEAKETFAHRLNHDVNEVMGSKLPWRVIITASDERSLPVQLAPGATVDPTEDFYDVYVFPDMLRIRSVSESRTMSVAHILLGEPVQDLLTEPLPFKWYVAVCTHAARDKRCGVIGVMVVDEFHTQFQRVNLQDQVRIAGSSHFGGHKFAGTCIIYPDGDWFGKLAPCDVQNIVDQYCTHGRIVRSKWRGRAPVVKGLPETSRPKQS